MAWYSVDHFKSDREYHWYCEMCHVQIPEFLIRHRTQHDSPPIGQPCEGCGTTFDQCSHHSEANARSLFRCEKEDGHTGAHNATVTWPGDDGAR